MKKLLFLIFLYAAAEKVLSQEFSYGIRGGVNVSNQNISTSGVSVSANSKIGYLVGGYATIMFTQKLGIQPELFFSSIGSKWPASLTGTSEAVIRLNYISIPVFLRYHVTEQFHLLAGPQLGILMTATGIYDGATADIKSSFNNSDIGGTFGAGADFDRLNVGVRYNFSFSNIVSNSGPSGETMKNTAFQIVAGYKLSWERPRLK